MSNNQEECRKDISTQKLQVLSKGNLDHITKTGSSKSQRGAPGNLPQSTTSSAASYAGLGSNMPSLQLLSPEDVVENDYDLQLEDMGSSESEYTSEDSADEETLTMTGRTSTMFGIPEPLTDRSRVDRDQQFDNESQFSEDDYMAVRQLALLENEDDDIDMDSEEERDIMAEIKAEITQKVREEMKSELEVYRKAKENLNKEEKDNPEEGLEGVEPKLKEAILKMRKLDKILAKKIKREKQVKRERIMLTKKLHEELESIIHEKKVTVDEKRNTDKFLSLALPPSHNAGISVEHPEREESPPPVTPVFQTQVPDEGRTVGDSGDTNSTDRSQQGQSGRKSSSRTTHSGATSVSGQSTSTTDSSGKKVKRKRKKDFIKRNIQLASDAANAIAMTDDEKKRVADLLSDLDMLPDVPEEDISTTSESPFLFQVAVPAGDGFTPSVEERKRLHDIDNRLKVIMPADEFEAISNRSSFCSSRTSMLFTRTEIGSMASGVNHGVDHDPGEDALKDTKDQREKQERLKNIEDELNQLTDAVQSEMDFPKLTEDQLNNLLDDCAKTMSRVTMETASIAEADSRSSLGTSRSSLYDNPPRLPDHVLKALLADARHTMGEDQLDSTGIQDDGTMVLESFSDDMGRDSVSSMSCSSARTTSRSSLPSRHHRQLSLKEASLMNGTKSPCDSTEEIRRPFLPEIDPKGRLSTQKLNNEAYLSSRTDPSRPPSNVYTVRNSFGDTTSLNDDSSSDSDSESSLSEDTPTPTHTPQPPSSGRKSNSGRGSRNKSFHL